MNNWFENFRFTPEYAFLKQRPVAYFCAEIALTENSPTYAGGLGILASDMIREAADNDIPLYAVSLFYREGYSHYDINSQGTVLEHPRSETPGKYGFSQVVDIDNKPIIVTVPLSGRNVKITAWEYLVKDSVRVLFLDTDIPDNDPLDRSITNRLYVSDKETRFKQEMVLGIGGLRFLAALKIYPGIYHLNEGHSALLAFEVVNSKMQELKKGFEEVLPISRQQIVFTNHTLIAAGNDLFHQSMAAALLTDYAKEIEVPLNTLVSYGLIPDSSIFSMTSLALRMSGRTNGVSKLHAQKAKGIWPEYSMISVTNGIHIPTWNKVTHREAIWEEHKKNKRELLRLIHEKNGITWEENDLVIGWARRMVRYKRPLALFQDKKRLLRLVNNTKNPIRIVIAGSAHESDQEGAALLKELQQIIGQDLQGVCVYLSGYNVGLAKIMTTGCDIWLNTPVVGFEACGTSGMKACLNGVLPCSTKDGWVDEIELDGIGWQLDNEDITNSIFSTLEKEIIPLYFDRDSMNIPVNWVKRMKKARDLVQTQFSASCMLKEYLVNMYPLEHR